MDVLQAPFSICYVARRLAFYDVHVVQAHLIAELPAILQCYMIIFYGKYYIRMNEQNTLLLLL